MQKKLLFTITYFGVIKIYGPVRMTTALVLRSSRCSRQLFSDSLRNRKAPPAREKSKALSPVEGLLVLLDLAARQLVELRVNVDELVLLLHLLALLEFVVDPLPPAEQAAELGVRWHRWCIYLATVSPYWLF